MITRGVLGSVLVLVGGLVVSVLPVSSPLDDLPLRHDTPGRLVGLGLVIGGLGLGGWAWLELLRRVRTGTGGMLLVHRAAASWSAPLLLAPAMFSRDGWSYAAQGVMTRVGFSPYEHGPSVLPGAVVEAVDPMWLDTPTPYGPLPLAWGALAAGLTREPWDLVVAHRLLALVGLALLAWAVPRLAAAAGRDPVYAAALVLPSPLVLAHGVAGLHNDLLMVGLMAVALAVALEERWVLGAALGGAAAAVKLPGGLVCVAVVLVSLPLAATLGDRLRRLVAVAGVSGGVLVAAGLATGLGVGWVHALGVPGVVRSPLSVTTQVGQLLSWLQQLAGLPGPSPVEVLRLTGTLLALALAAACALRAPTGVPATAVRMAALTALAMVVLSPVVHHWYALWVVPFLAATRLGPRAEAALVGLLGLVGLVAPLDSTLRARGTDIAVAVVLVVGVAVTQAVGHRRALAAAPREPARLVG
ncbi:polyprenol phosphomannose-dependent alpha 1,6 mannosyltransferase MptB [Nocardioides sp. SOB77]|uniref:Polyprenol phosphomannose-dependent alpha 1,6 mannosyltransferase MptB n=1 Tax=Nocardioides oceani TaxID=3058369 RepID=A0ABT8FJA1_9ACTN|nr:polyprenol phosphomannose-dependent alpha 1,6 mannosyltransferase MptB [Nocardioides oceani]MDN4174467.1 polyprenol phosphomannose-dependent alpha 1,6 mannosyltransferase MptB [Nocardioides oceani]